MAGFANIEAINVQPALPGKRGDWQPLSGVERHRSRDSCVSADAPDQLEPRVQMSSFARRREHYRYVGLRACDIQTLRHWRNAQIAVLRQNKPLTENDQQRWFNNVVQPMHQQPSPTFLLVSILDQTQQFLGYGGLTNIDWDNRRAEVSFLVDPARADNLKIYRQDFLQFLHFLQSWAFDELSLHRLVTETYALRDEHIKILEAAGFVYEGRLIDHIAHPFEPDQFMDSILHGVVTPAR